VGIGDPVARLHAVTEQMQRLKASHQTVAGGAVVAAAELAPPLLLSLGIRAGTALLRRMPQRSVNTVTTNVPGPPHALYALGREMVEYLPFVPLSQGVRIGVAILSYHGRLAFGVTGDYDAAPDARAMADRIEEGLAELVTLARDHATRTPVPARRRDRRHAPAS
jgi:diacylglycerol O-acyltransferase